MPDLLAPKLPMVGSIIEWSGTIALIPTGYYLCDGTKGTPDLRDTFIRGAPGGSDAGGTGGENTHVLITSELPQHTHGLTDPGHTHTTTVAGGTGGSHYTDSGDFPVTTVTMTSVTASPTIANTGSGTAHENKPAFFAVLYLRRGF